MLLTIWRDQLSRRYFLKVPAFAVSWLDPRPIDTRIGFPQATYPFIVAITCWFIHHASACNPIGVFGALRLSLSQGDRTAPGGPYVPQQFVKQLLRGFHTGIQLCLVVRGAPADNDVGTLSADRRMAGNGQKPRHAIARGSGLPVPAQPSIGLP
jgi:hypothetical protein